MSLIAQRGSRYVFIHSLPHFYLTCRQVHRKHLLPDTLIAYHLPWDWDEVSYLPLPSSSIDNTILTSQFDGNYIIIKQWISEDFQEELFAHTRRIRDGRLVSENSHNLTELKVNDRNKDKMYLVRKKTPNHRAWLFT